MQNITMAQSVGEEWVFTDFTPGVDFDPTDLEEVEIIRLATEAHRYDRIHALERENAWLARQVEQLREQLESYD